MKAYKNGGITNEYDIEMENMVGGYGSKYYRKISGGEWKHAFSGHMAPLCSDVSSEVKSVFKGIENAGYMKDDHETFEKF